MTASAPSGRRSRCRGGFSTPPLASRRNDFSTAASASLGSRSDSTSDSVRYSGKGREVYGGGPATLRTRALLAQLVEHLHGKEGVDGSSPSEGSAKAPHVGAFTSSVCCISSSLPRYEIGRAHV